MLPHCGGKHAEYSVYVPNRAVQRSRVFGSIVDSTLIHKLNNPRPSMPSMLTGGVTRDNLRFRQKNTESQIDADFTDFADFKRLHVTDLFFWE